MINNFSGLSKKRGAKIISLHVSKEARQLKAWSQTKRSISSSNLLITKSTRPQNDVEEDKNYPVTGNSKVKTPSRTWFSPQFVK